MTSWFRLTRILPIASLFLVALNSCAAGALAQTKEETQSPRVRAIGRRLEEKGVPNFGEVTPNLYRGGLLNTTGLKALARMGVSIVVDTHANDASEEKVARSLGMQYVAIPWHCPWPKDEVFVKFLKLLHENKGKKVFVHCRLGDDRSRHDGCRLPHGRRRLDSRRGHERNEDPSDSRARTTSFALASRATKKNFPSA